MSGTHLTDPHIISVQIGAKSFRERFHRELGGAVHIAVRINFLAGTAADIHNMPFSALYHTGRYHPGNIQHTLDIGVNHRFPVIQTTLVNGAEPFGKACIVNQHINLPEIIGDAVEGSFHFLIPAHVEGKKQYIGSVSLFQVMTDLIQTLSPAAVQYKSVTVTGEHFCRSASYSRSRSGNQYNR